MGGKGKQHATTRTTQWSCGQCGAFDSLEMDPYQHNVCYCGPCWDAWPSKFIGKAVQSTTKATGKNNSKGATKNKDYRAGDQSRAKGKARSSGKSKSQDAGKSDVPPETCPEEALEHMANMANDVYKNLPHGGRQVWKALNTCIQSTIRAGVVHFERSLRAELEVQLGDVELERQAGSQWLVTIRGAGRPTVCYASVRSEVLGARGAELLAELKQTARLVKNTLLDQGASWLRDLADAVSTRKEFLDEVRELRETDGGRRSKGKGKGADAVEDRVDCERCPICKKGLTQDRLGGKHMCRIIASFKCCSKWTSHAGRYNLEEQRVMGQRCKRCGQEGLPLDDWQLAGEMAFGGDEKPHRSELCEACDRYGNCRGAFFDPFQISMAVETITGQPANWQAHARGHIWTTHIQNEIIVLQPHVHMSIN
eukprot:TRINITY_DN25996_c0_g1_i1.p1 TRINITY_DN25996_c0_g1~~TRINITY_DN25996_c0_g1_i1.p1  ORF type:complete len:424 (+),score=67.26 TRINITY_DN25996_c0_g1_i1:49-1320(+)